MEKVRVVCGQVRTRDEDGDSNLTRDSPGNRSAMLSRITFLTGGDDVVEQGASGADEESGGAVSNSRTSRSRSVV